MINDDVKTNDLNNFLILIQLTFQTLQKKLLLSKGLDSYSYVLFRGYDLCCGVFHLCLTFVIIKCMFRNSQDQDYHLDCIATHNYVYSIFPAIV